jgi:WG containing repeat
MKLQLLALFLCTSFGVSAQIKKIKRDDLLLINKDWRLVKTNANTYGIENGRGKIIVQPIYVRIEKFGSYAKNLALVKNISDGYGFIDTTGKEIIPAHYDLSYIKSSFSLLKTKYLEQDTKK